MSLCTTSYRVRAIRTWRSLHTIRPFLISSGFCVDSPYTTYSILDVLGFALDTRHVARPFSTNVTLA